MTSKEDQNEYGLTFIDWCRAAAWPEITLLKARTEWIGGVDPNDYRALHSRKIDAGPSRCGEKIWHDPSACYYCSRVTISRDTRKKGPTNNDM